MKKFNIILLVLFFSVVLNAGNFGFGVTAGTQGFGGQVILPFINPINVRAGVNIFNITPDLGEIQEEDYTFDATLNLKSAYALFDYFPSQNHSFRFTAGMYMNMNKIESDIQPTDTYTIGGDEYTPDKLGDVGLELNFNKFCPYIGIGNSPRLGTKQGISVSFDFGGFYHGKPNADLTAEGLLAPTADADQEKNIQSNIEGFTWYPVLSMGLIFTF